MLPRPRLLALALGSVTAAGVLWTVADYRAWRALGPGGLPPTWRGWLRTTRWRLAKQHPLAIEPLASHWGGPADVTLLANLPRRRGPRPRVAPHPVPHRQTTDGAPPAIRTALAALIADKVKADPSRLILATSHFERNTPAITLKPTFRHHADACAACGEVGHAHDNDGSLHVIVSASDARTVIERGWGERHGLAGSHLGLPLTYMMIYAPRDERELAVTSDILDAAIAYQALDPARMRAAHTPSPKEL